MSIIDLEDAFPIENGIYKVLVDSVDGISFEAKAKWRKGEGFQLIENILPDDAYVSAWKSA